MLVIKKISLGEIKLASDNVITLQTNNSVTIDKLVKMVAEATDNNFDLSIDGSLIKMTKK